MASKILVYGDATSESAGFPERLREQYDVVVPANLEDGLLNLQNDNFAGVLLLGEESTAPGSLLHASGILDQIPDGLVLLDQDLNVLWCNSRVNELSAGCRANEDPTEILGCNFYTMFGTPEILGPDFCPFNTAMAAGEAAKSVLRIGEKSYFELHVKPVFRDGADEMIPVFLVVIVRDVSAEVLQKQKLNAIYHAGLELGDLSPQEILEMSVQKRIELLKQKILHYTQDLLQFETVEIRLVDKNTKQLEPLLAVGMEPDAADRDLVASPQDNGVTGFVAATGKSYLCEDTESDPLYLPGAPGARSSLTVPLILHDEIQGTFNVESPNTGAFDENDLQFLELFSREVAAALNTLELLVAEKLTTATENTEMILREVANPVDEILNDATWVLERYIGHEPNVSERLSRILKHTRDIKQLIHKVGDSIAPEGRSYSVSGRDQRPKLKSKRVLVTDSDDAVRQAAHELLGRVGCDVETAHNGEEALLMCRRFDYDVVIVDIRLPDMNGYECFHQLKEIHPDLQVILMTGFGYDPSHSIVKARKEGLKAVLYKPFRLDQLLTEVETAVCASSDVTQESASQ